MQTSNKIFISFLIFLFGSITLLFIGAKFYKGYYHESNYTTQEQKIQSFSVIVLEPKAELMMKNGTAFTFLQHYRKGTKPNSASFKVKNDTLFVFALKSKIGGIWGIMPQIVSCKNVKRIIAKENSKVNIQSYLVDSLFVTLNKAHLQWISHKKQDFVKFEAKHSFIEIEGGSFENIDVALNKSTLNINSNNGIKEISGTLKNRSHGTGTIDGKINLQVDKSSNFNL